MINFYKLISFLVIWLILPYSLISQVVINEFSCSNISTVSDVNSEFNDWIELYNSSSSAVNLDGYYLSDKENNPTKWQIPAVNIPANGYLVFFASNKDGLFGANYHTNFKLTQAKQEFVVLANPSGTIIDSYWMEIPTMKDHSRGRFTDGDPTWGVFTSPTPGTANAGAMIKYADKPTLSLASGYYGSAISLNLATTEPNSEIRYTTNGDEPQSTSSLYSSAINISNTQVIKARTFSADANIIDGFIETNTYFINDQHTVPVISISGDEIGTLLNGSQIEPIGSLEYFDESQNLMDEAVGEFNKHGNDSWAYDQRGFDYITRDEYGYNNNIHHQIFRNKDRDNFQRLIIKAAANDNYPFGDGAHIRDSYVQSLSQIGHLKLDERSYEPCILYVNGEYWGVYDTREKVDDHDFTDYYYDQGKDDIDFIKTWGSTWADYGTMDDWNDLHDFISTNDMSVDANYQYVKDRYNYKSLVDYVVLNSYIVTSDWLNWNTAWWRGRNPDGDKKKWRYVLWDMDATFGHYINYTGIPDQSADADPCDPETLSGSSDPEGHITILNKLMENPEFEQYYVARYIDLTNSVFTCEYMHAHLDSLINIIEPEMQRQIDKWGGTYAEWEDNVQTMRDFIDDRCAVIDNGMIDCYDLTGPFEITIIVEPPLSGYVDINSLNLENYPWTGTYFGDIETFLEANAETGYMFDFWELDSNSVAPNINGDYVILSLIASDTIIAHFVPQAIVDLGNDTIICPNTSIVLDAENPGATYLWQDNSTEQTFTVTDAGTYSVTVTIDGFSLSDEIIVSYSTIAVVEDEFTICNGGDTQFNVSGGVSYNWYPDTGLNDPFISNPIASPLTTTEYSVTITDEVGCEYYEIINVNVLDPVQVTVSANTLSTCPDKPIVIDITASEGSGAPYTLYSNEGDILNLPYIVYPQSTQDYTIYASDDCGSIASETITINVYPAPVAIILADDNTVCEGTEIEFNGTSAGNIISYEWEIPEAVTTSLNSSIVQATYSHEGSYDVTLTVISSDDCKSTATRENFVNIYSYPLANFNPDPPIATEINPVIYFENTSSSFYKCIWTFANLGSTDEISPTYTFDDIGTYNVTLEVTNEHNCESSITKQVVIENQESFYAPTAFTPTSELNEKFYITGNGISEKGFEMIIYSRWGEIVYSTNEYNPNIPSENGWNGRVNNGEYAEAGVYKWVVYYKDFNGVNRTKSGNVTLLR